MSLPREWYPTMDHNHRFRHFLFHKNSAFGRCKLWINLLPRRRGWINSESWTNGASTRNREHRKNTRSDEKWRLRHREVKKNVEPLLAL